jgi:hypothetical protein
MADQQQHQPIVPPPELKQQWLEQAPRYRDCGVGRAHWLIDRAAHWGYEQRGEVNEAKLQEARDQELEACIAWFDRHIPGYELVADRLRSARRPPPPSDKEQACKLLQCYGTSGVQLTADQCNTILRALGALPND